MREREMIKGRLSRVRPADHPDRPIKVEVGRRRTGPEKEGDKQKTCPLLQSRERGRERGSLHLFRLRILKSRILWLASAYELRHTKLQKQSHEFRCIIPPQPPTQPYIVFEGVQNEGVFERVRAMRRERGSGAGGRQDKLIFEHFQTPLSPPGPAAPHRVCLPGSGLNPS